MYERTNGRASERQASGKQTSDRHIKSARRFRLWASGGGGDERKLKFKARRSRESATICAACCSSDGGGGGGGGDGQRALARRGAAV